ncbi:MAG TPA: radical SAM protein [Chitinophagaceae bacterium]
MKYYNSRYNFCFPAGADAVLYNAGSGCTISLPECDPKKLSGLLCSEKLLFDEDFFEEDTLGLFVLNGFLIEEYRNELMEIRERYWNARDETPVVLTLTTTMDCNLGCYYCYENRSKHQLSFKEVPEIIERLDYLFSNSKKRSLHVDWYGGEPLLNPVFIEEASIAIQEFCCQRGISYHASIISNGTVWPDDLESFICRHKIRQVQISFDGLKENHNKKRRFRKEYANGQNSFDIIVALIDRLLNHVQVDIRLNIDFRNKDEVDEFIEFIRQRGWFSKKYPAVFQPARIASYSERSSFLEQTQLSLNEFDEIRHAVTQTLKGVTKVEESEVPDGYPFPKTYVCAALAKNSFVVGADKLIYRCGLQVGETNRAVDTLDKNSNGLFNDRTWWEEFDPTRLPSCSKCSFLPVCLGGCPKKHLDRDQHALDEQSLYWRNNLANKVLSYIGADTREKIIFGEPDQFRDGYN